MRYVTILKFAELTGYTEPAKAGVFIGLPGCCDSFAASHIRH